LAGNRPSAAIGLIGHLTIAEAIVAAKVRIRLENDIHCEARRLAASNYVGGAF
jgi:hypothetical protein